METLAGKGLCLLKASTLLRKLFWEVTSAIQEQYSQAIIVPHFVITNRSSDAGTKICYGRKVIRKCVFRNFL